MVFMHRLVLFATQIFREMVIAVIRTGPIVKLMKITK